MNHFIETLRSIGLSEIQSRVYLALLEHPDEPVTVLAKRLAVNRSQLYGVLAELQQQGLASSTYRDRRQYFRAASPDALDRLVNQRQRDLAEILPALANLQGPPAQGMQVEVFDGIGGLKAALREHLEFKEYLVLGAANEFSEKTTHFYEQYHALRIKKKVEQRILFRTEATERAKRANAAPHSSARLLPSTYKVPLVIVVYGNNSALISWADERIVVLRSALVADGFREQFRILWDVGSVP